MSPLLYDEKPLIVNPQLAALIGLTEAIILQQVHYWLYLNAQAGHNLREGYYWTYNTYQEWAEQFPFWSRNTIIRSINKLEREGLLISKVFNAMRGDRTKWYRLNYERIAHLPKLSKWSTQNGQMVSPKWVNDLPGLGKAIPETNTEITSDISMRGITDIFKDAMEELKTQVNRSNYRTWIAGLEPISFDGKVFVLGAETPFITEYCSKNLGSLFAMAFSKAADLPVQVTFKVAALAGERR